MASGIYGVEIDSTVLGAITSQGVNTGTEVQSDPTSGQIYATFVAVRAQKPTASWMTMAIAAALDLVGLSGTSIDGLATGLKLYAQKYATGGTRAAGGSHRKYTINSGLIIPRTLTIDHQGDASLPMEVVVTYDGTNDPVIPTDSQAVPAGLSDGERFTLGPIQIGGVTLSKYRQVQIDFGINARTIGSQSDVWDRQVGIGDTVPIITIRGIDPEWFKSTNIPLLGKIGTHANTIIYLRKRILGGTFELDAATEHIKFTGDGLAVIDTPFDGTHDTEGETSLTMTLRNDGSNPPLLITTGSAIT